MTAREVAHMTQWQDTERYIPTCAHCGGAKSIRNPTGSCDHLFWPDNLTNEAKVANGYVRVVRVEWVPLPPPTEGKTE